MTAAIKESTSVIVAKVLINDNTDESRKRIIKLVEDLAEREVYYVTALVRVAHSFRYEYGDTKLGSDEWIEGLTENVNNLIKKHPRGIR